MANNQIFSGQARMIRPGEMVLDPGNRQPVNIDTRSAVAAVEADGNAFARADMGQAKIGEAVGGIGDHLQELALKQMEAINITKRAEAQDAMSAGEYEMQAAMMKEKDEMKWPDIATAHAAKVREKIDKMNLSPVAKAAVDSDFSRWQIHRTGQTQIESAKQSIDKAKGVSTDRLNLFKKTQDRAGFDETLKGMKSMGLISEEGAKLHELDYAETGRRKAEEAQSVAEKTTLENVMTTARGDTDAAEKLVKSPEFGKGLSPFVKEKALDIVRGQKRDQFIDAQTAVMDGLATAASDPKAAFTENDVDRVAPKGLSPSERLHLKEIVAKDHSDAARAEAAKPEVIRERFGRLLDLAAKFDPTKTGGVESQETRDQFQYIMMESSLLPEKLRGEVTQPVSERWRVGAPKIDTTIKGYINESLLDLYDNGGFGATTKDVPGPNTWDKPTKATDVEGQKKARAGFADARIALNEWMEQNPKASREEATAAIYRMSGQTMRADEAAKLLKKANTDTTAAPAGNFDWNGAAAKLTGKTDAVRGFMDTPDLKDKLPTGLKPHAQDFIDAAKEYGLNPRVLAAISSLETGGGTSKAFREKLNAMGISDSSGPTSQPSVRDSIFRQAKRLAAENGPYSKAKSIEEIGAIYAPPGAENDPKGTNGGWSEGVRSWLSRF